MAIKISKQDQVTLELTKSRTEKNKIGSLKSSNYQNLKHLYTSNSWNKTEEDQQT